MLPPTPCESRSPKYDVRKLCNQSFLTSFFVYSGSKNNVNNCIFPFYCTWNFPVQQQYTNEKGGMFLLNPQLLSLLPAIITIVTCHYQRCQRLCFCLNSNGLQPKWSLTYFPKKLELGKPSLLLISLTLKSVVRK